MARTSRAEWIKRVERWPESKLSAEAFAAQLGIKAARLRYRDWKLKQHRAEPTEASHRQVPSPRTSSFVEVSPALPVERSSIEIVTLLRTVRATYSSKRPVASRSRWYRL